MTNQSADNTDKREYQAPVLFEYGDVASITNNGGSTPGDGILGDENPSTT